MSNTFAERCTSLCLEIYKLNVELPIVRDAENNSKSFSWTKYYPDLELEIWLFKQEDYYAECLLTVKNNDWEVMLTSEEDVLAFINRYIAHKEIQ